VVYVVVHSLKKYFHPFQANRHVLINVGRYKTIKTMSEAKKLTEEEITQIKEMQTQYNKFVFELGSVEAQLSDMASHRITMETEKSSIIGDLKSLNVREKELLTTLQEKYGVGNINIETGEITPF